MLKTSSRVRPESTLVAKLRVVETEGHGANYFTFPHEVPHVTRTHGSEITYYRLQSILCGANLDLGWLKLDVGVSGKWISSPGCP